MNTYGQIFMVHPSLNLIEVLVEHLLERDHLSSALIIFPHRRPAEFFKYYLSKKIEKPVLLPKIKAFEDWVIEYSAEVEKDPGVLLEILDQAWFVYQAVVEVFSEKGEKVPKWDEFFPWAIRLSKLFQELDKELIDVKDLPYPPEEVLSEKAVKLLEKQGKIYRKFKEILKEKGFTTSAEKLRYLAENDVPLPSPPVYLVGFYALTRAENELFKKFFEKGAYFYWHTAPENLPELYQRWLDEWKKSYEITPIKITSKKTKNTEIYFFEAHDLHSELEELKKRLPENIEDVSPDKIAIVLPVADNLLPLLHYLPEGPVNVTMGYPLKFTGLVSFLNTLFDLVLRFHPERGFKTSDFLELLKSPYLKPIPWLIKELTDYGGTFVKKEKIFELSGNEKEYINNLFENLIDPVISAQTPRELASALKGVFKVLKLRHPTSPLEKEAIATLIEKVIYPVTSFFFADEKMEKRALFNLFREMFNRITVPFEGDPLEGIQVMGLLETRLLSFEKVFVIDVNEGVLPSVEEINPLLPQKVRLLLGLPNREREEAIIRYHFERLIYSATEVHLFWQYCTTASSETGLENKKIRSRYVEKLIWNMENSEKKIFEKSSYKDKLKKSNISLNPIALKRDAFIKKDENMKEKIIEKLNPIAPTLLETYLTCPLQFFYAKVLEIEGVQKKTEVAHDELGSAVHEALEEYFQELTNLRNGINLEGISVMKKDLNFNRLWEIFEDKLKRKKFYQIISPERKFLLEETAKFRLKKYLEERHPVETKVVALEKAIVKNFEIPQFGNFKLYGRLDRVDLRENRSYEFYLILDYKTGYVDRINKKFLELSKEKVITLSLDDRSLKEVNLKLKHFQLLFYIYLWGKFLREDFKVDWSWEQISAGYVKLYREGEEEYIKIYSQENTPYKKWFEEDFPVLLEFIIRHILDAPYWYPTEDKKICRFCSYSLICRHSI